MFDFQCVTVSLLKVCWVICIGIGNHFLTINIVDNFALLFLISLSLLIRTSNFWYNVFFVDSGFMFLIFFQCSLHYVFNGFTPGAYMKSLCSITCSGSWGSKRLAKTTSLFLCFCPRLWFCAKWWSDGLIFRWGVQHVDWFILDANCNFSYAASTWRNTILRNMKCIDFRCRRVLVWRGKFWNGSWGSEMQRELCTIFLLPFIFINHCPYSVLSFVLGRMI